MCHPGVGVLHTRSRDATIKLANVCGSESRTYRLHGSGSNVCLLGVGFTTGGCFSVRPSLDDACSANQREKSLVLILLSFPS
jgi:hypothetical protein